MAEKEHNFYYGQSMKVNVRIKNIVHNIFHINLNFFDRFFQQNITSQISMVQSKNIYFDFEVKGQGYE